MPAGNHGLAFETLVRPHFGRLYKFAYRLTGSREEAEDLVQNVCIKLYPRVRELGSVNGLGPWLAKVLYNQFIDDVRRRVRNPLDYCSELPEVAAEGSDPEAQAAADADAALIYAALAKLSREHRAVIVWHDIEGYTLDELGGMHDVALGTLKSRLHRARAQLRALLMEPFSVVKRDSS